MPPRAQLQELTAIRDDLRAEMLALKNRIEGVEIAIEAISVNQRPLKQRTRHPRGWVKVALLELLEEVGDIGLNAQSAVDLAKQKKIELDRNTVSSLLSRFKRDGVVDHDGHHYRLKGVSRFSSPMHFEAAE